LYVQRIQSVAAGLHVISPDSHSFNTALARKSLFFTVPSGICLISAISSYDRPVKWRSVMSSRDSGGRPALAPEIAWPRSVFRSSEKGSGPLVLYSKVDPPSRSPEGGG